MQKVFFFLTLFSIVNLGYSQKPMSLPVSDTAFVNLRDYDAGFIYDMKYASTDNFLKARVYDCGECYLRLKTVKALVEARRQAAKHGLCIKLFDCYRPVDVQRKMWAIVPNARYVANPKTGSIHNRGGAVDITLTDSLGQEIDMGTKFDDFSKKAAHDYVRLPKKIRKNREMLREIMESAGFNALNSEWWHYNLANSGSDKVSNFTWKCD